MTKKILITGATGYLGSHMVKELLKNNYEVAILKRSFSRTWRIDDVIDQVVCYDVDKLDLRSIFLSLGKVYAIIHTSTCYGKNSESITEIFRTNTLFPLELLEAASNIGVKVFINTDTFNNKENIPYRGLPEYSLSKYQFSEWGREYAYTKKIRFIDIKLEHVFGACEENSKFTSYIIQSLLRNKYEIELTSGEQIRDFVYIKDIISAYLTILDSIDYFDEFQELQLGSGKAISLREFVETILKLTNSKSVLKFGAIPYRQSEIMASQANIEPLKRLGWFPKYNLEDALIEIINAYKTRED